LPILNNIFLPYPTRPFIIIDVEISLKVLSDDLSKYKLYDFAFSLKTIYDFDPPNVYLRLTLERQQQLGTEVNEPELQIH
jgi:hypothetical protein